PVVKGGGGICPGRDGIVAGSLPMGPGRADVPSRTRAWLTLALVPGLGPAQARRLADRHGGPEAACALSPAALTAAGVTAEVVAGWSQARARAAREIDRLAALGASLRAWGGPAYPAPARADGGP